MPNSAHDDQLASLAAELRAIRAEMLALEEQGLSRSTPLHPAQAASARNLLHYLALRRRDVRPVQDQLARLGLSSLGRCEAAALTNLDAVLDVLDRLQGGPPRPRGIGVATLELEDGNSRLQRHAEDLLGPTRGDRGARIMVTLPPEAADEPAIVRGLLAAGMDCARINCAHDDEAAWGRMVHHLRAADGATRRTRILMDLAGPKIRTGPLLPHTAVHRLHPERDRRGRVRAPAVAQLVAQDSAPSGNAVFAGPRLPVSGAWIAQLLPGDRIRCVDARGSRRKLVVADVGPGSARLECDKTVYVASGLALHAWRGHHRIGDEAIVGELAEEARAVRIHRGDLLELTRSLEPGREAVLDARGAVLEPARIGCTMPELFDQVKVGDRIFFDDGRLGGVIRAADPERLLVEVREATSKGEDLRADMGINFPDSALALAALTEKDLRDLAFVARNADAVALSFVSRPEDVHELQEQLRRLGAPDLGVVLKIETRRGFERLPDLLLAAMRSRCDGVMIARGDLAVECGWERLAEVQEQILWIAEAAHMPVIWATQVLERLAKEGRPSRAEITDAAMGERAECVMLNKGPHLPLAVRTLDDILRRMRQHQQKKRSMLRPLRVAGAEARPGARECQRWVAVDAARADVVVEAVGARPGSVVGAHPVLAQGLACVRERDAEVSKVSA